MKDIRIRVPQTAMKWHIKKYRNEGYELVTCDVTPHGKIKHACLQGAENRIILTPIPPKKWRNQDAVRRGSHWKPLEESGKETQGM